MNAPSEKSVSNTGLGWIKHLALIVSLYSLGLTLLGYGYDLAYLGELGLSPELAQRTPWDFLIRSYKPLAEITVKVTNALSLELAIDFTNIWLSDPVIWTSLWCLAALVPFVAFFPNRRESMLWKLAGQLVNTPWVKRFGGAASAAAAWTKLRFDDRKNRLRLLGYLGWVAPPLGAALLVFLMYWVFVAVTFFALFGVIFGPMMGFNSGKRDANTRIEQAVGCVASTLNQQPCVAISRDGCEVARGRLIDIGTTRIFLRPLDSNRGILSVPLERNTVSVLVGEEATKSVAKTNCAQQSN